MWKSKQDESGQAIVEFAAVMVPLFLLFLLAIDGGLFFYAYVSGAHAVREGARCGVVGGSVANIQARVVADLPGSSPTVTVTRTDSNGDGVIGTGDRIEIKARWTYTWVSPLSSFGLVPTTTKTYFTTMRLETDKTDRACS